MFWAAALLKKANRQNRSYTSGSAESFLMLFGRAEVFSQAFFFFCQMTQSMGAMQVEE